MFICAVRRIFLKKNFYFFADFWRCDCRFLVWLLDKNLHAFSRIMIWNFFCTLWASLEGTSLIYMMRIEKRLRDVVHGRSGQNRGLVFNFYLIIFLFMILGIVYAGYHFYAWNIYKKYNLSANHFYNMTTFYLRICGSFWVIFESMIAVNILKIFFCVKVINGNAAFDR